MSGDRGTLPHGVPPMAQDVGPRPRPPGPSSRRQPRAPRERRPALVALALLLVVAAALGIAYLLLQNAPQVAAIEITQPLGVGEQIPLHAMHQIQIASGTGLGYVPWDEASQVTHFYAATGIAPGTLLTSAMVARTNPLPMGKSVVGLALKGGQLPDGLQAGDHVNLYQVSDTKQSCPGAPGSVIASNAIVLAVSPPPASPGGSGADVRVAIAPAVAGAVTCNAANGNVAVAVLPGSATGATG